MTEIRFTIEDDFLQNLRINLRHNTKASDIMRDALTVYNWCAEERANGRVIASMGLDGEQPARLVFPALERAVPLPLKKIWDQKVKLAEEGTKAAAAE